MMLSFDSTSEAATGNAWALDAVKAMVAFTAAIMMSLDMRRTF
jgi:hypothetical protein